MSTSNSCHTPDRPYCPEHEASPVTSPSCLSLMLLPPRLLAASLSGAANVIRKTLNGEFLDTGPSCHHDQDKHKFCCEIPETACPDLNVCHIHWSGCPGDKLHYQIEVTNTAKIKRIFTLTPLPFSCTDDEINLSINQQSLLPNKSLKTTASFIIPKSFGGGNYHTRIKVAGAYEQFILVYLTVRPHQDYCCSIEQGEIPKHIKAHRWYHHFQCEEPCFEAVPQPTIPSKTSTSTKDVTTKNKPIKKGNKRG